MNVMVKNRNVSVECYRVLLMFGICVLHSITMCGHPNRFSALLWPCVNGFVFISGWFGINFSFKRLGKLVFNAVFAGGMAVLLTWIFMPEQLSWTKDCFKTLRYVVIGQWFFLEYVVLMLVAPTINFVIDGISAQSSRKILVPLGTLLIWNWLYSLPYLDKLPYPTGFGSYTSLALINTYLVARLIRRFDFFRYLTIVRALMGLSLLSAGFLVFYKFDLSCYSSPLAIAFAALVFYLFLRMPNFQCRLISMIAPSMFTVYLLHSHRFGFVAMLKLENWFFANQYPQVVCYLIPAILVFISGVVADIPRRLVMWAYRKLRSDKRENEIL